MVLILVRCGLFCPNLHTYWLKIEITTGFACGFDVFGSRLLYFIYSFPCARFLPSGAQVYIIFQNRYLPIIGYDFELHQVDELKFASSRVSQCEEPLLSQNSF